MDGVESGGQDLFHLDGTRRTSRRGLSYGWRPGELKRFVGRTLTIREFATEFIDDGVTTVFAAGVGEETRAGVVGGSGRRGRDDVVVLEPGDDLGMGGVLVDSWPTCNKSRKISSSPRNGRDRRLSPIPSNGSLAN